MPQKKRQHYVPRFCLKNFSIGKQGKRIGLYNIRTSRFVASAKLKTQACQNYFYGTGTTIEDALQAIEDRAAGIIAEILRTGTLPTRLSAEHYALLVFVLFQHSRTMYAVEETNEMTDKSAKTVLSRDPRASSDLDKVRIGLTKPVLLALGSAGMAVPVAFDLEYRLLIKSPLKKGSAILAERACYT